MPGRIGYLRPRGAPTPADNRKAYDSARQEDKNFYSGERWRRLRFMILRSEPLCAECKRNGRVTRAHHVHHIQPRKLRPDLAYDPTNLEALCPSCHNAMPER